MNYFMRFSLGQLEYITKTWIRYYITLRPHRGLGAHPLPARFQRLWDQVEHVVDGGFPYSEGIYDASFAELHVTDDEGHSLGDAAYAQGREALLEWVERDDWSSR